MSGISRCSLDLAHQGYHYRDLQHNEMDSYQLNSFISLFNTNSALLLTIYYR